MTALYDRIAEKAEHLGISGKELGNKLGLKKSPLTDWKNNKSKPTLEQIVLLCDIFATSSDYLLFGKSSYLSENEIELLNTYAKLDVRGKHRVHTIIYDELDRIQNAMPIKSEPDSKENQAQELQYNACHLC